MDYDNDYNKEYDSFQKLAAAVTLGGTALGALGKGVAGFSQNRAIQKIKTAQTEYAHAFQSFEEASSQTQQSICRVVNLKKKIMENHMKHFLRSYKRLNPNISFKNSSGLDELQRFIPEKQEFRDLRVSANVYARFNQSRLGEKAANVALVMVQDGTVKNISHHVKNIRYAERIKDSDLKRASSDDLKIASIGVLSQFSTIAVEFAMEGLSDAISSMRKLNEATQYAAQYNNYTQQLKLNKTKVEAIGRYADIHINLLEKYLTLLSIYIPRTVKIISKKDNFLHFGRIKQQKFTMEELQIMAFTFSLVGAVKAIIDSPIIAENGEVYSQEDPSFEKAKSSISSFENKQLALPSVASAG